MKSSSINLAVLALAVSACASASAQTAGTWMAKGGYNHFFTRDSSGDITGVPGAQIAIGNGGAAFGSVAYMITDHVATEFTFGIAPKFDIYGAGTIGLAGKLAQTKAAPGALSVQYRFFEPKAAFRPYVGAAIVYAMFSDTTATPAVSALTGVPTTISIDNKWGWSVQAGATYAINEKWFIDGAVIPMFIKTTGRFSTGQTIDVKANLVAVNLALGYRF